MKLTILVSGANEFGANGGAYTKHTLPTGATPVSEVDGKRCRGPWEFVLPGIQK